MDPTAISLPRMRGASSLDSHCSDSDCFTVSK